MNCMMYGNEKVKYFWQVIEVYARMSGLTFGWTYFSFGKSRQNHFVIRKLGHIPKFIQHLEKRHLANVFLTSNNATDVPTNQINFYSSYVELTLD